MIVYFLLRIEMKKIKHQRVRKCRGITRRSIVDKLTKIKYYKLYNKLK